MLVHVLCVTDVQTSFEIDGLPWYTSSDSLQLSSEKGLARVFGQQDWPDQFGKPKSTSERVIIEQGNSPENVFGTEHMIEGLRCVGYTENMGAINAHPHLKR